MDEEIIVVKKKKQVENCITPLKKDADSLSFKAEKTATSPYCPKLMPFVLLQQNREKNFTQP